ncbi:MAG: sulfotransferase [Streptosporangiales bacterium]|nr:sulfotransferase [Streptosporangiales bacterium]
MRVGYLGGLGRSGTTLLARLLGSLPGVCDVGELCHLWERGVVADERCGCGRAFHDCPFWQAVGERAFGGWQHVDVTRIGYLRSQVDRARHVPKLARPPRTTRRLLIDYLRVHEQLYAAISEISGCDLVLDSSKHGSLAFCLHHARELDLRIVHCVRDSRAVAYSWQRTVQRPEAAQPSVMPVYSPLRSAALWTLENGLIEALGRRGNPVHLLRYEDLVDDPMAALRAVCRFLDCPEPPPGLVSDHTAHLAASHSVSGNPMRFLDGAVSITPDEAWRRERSSAATRLVSALTLPLRLKYGYT